jgi:hypothetical protein
VIRNHPAPRPAVDFGQLTVKSDEVVGFWWGVDLGGAVTGLAAALN